jgi:hypothetical protein
MSCLPAVLSMRIIRLIFKLHTQISIIISIIIFVKEKDFYFVISWYKASDKTRLKPLKLGIHISNFGSAFVSAMNLLASGLWLSLLSHYYGIGGVLHV